MIEAIRLFNFQCHSKLEIELDEHVTTIIGDNDVGKTAILRGLRWACLNKPAGGRFLKNGEDVVRVEVDVDGHTITREKGNGNTYYLDEKEFKSFQANPPDEIVKLLNVTEDNFQRQLSAHYWFSETAGQVGRELNAIVNLELIDSSLAAVASEVKKAKSTAEVSEIRLRRAREKKKDLNWILECQADYGVVEAKEGQYREAAEKLARLASALANATRASASARNADKLLKSAEIAVAAGGQWAESAEKLRNLNGLLSKAAQAQERLCEAKKRLKQTQKLLDEVDHCPLCLQPFAPKR